MEKEQNNSRAIDDYFKMVIDELIANDSTPQQIFDKLSYIQSHFFQKGCAEMDYLSEQLLSYLAEYYADAYEDLTEGQSTETIDTESNNVMQEYQSIVFSKRMIAEASSKTRSKFEDLKKYHHSPKKPQAERVHQFNPFNESEM